MVRKRLFIALDMPDYAGHILSMLKTVVNEPRDSLKWMSPENLHITLSFLGNLEENRIPRIVNDLSISLENRKFRCSISGTRVFPNMNHPKVLWLPIKTGRKDIIELQNIVNRTMTPYKEKKEEKQFIPHMTIARVKQNAKPWKLKLQNYMNIIYKPIIFDVNSVQLYESELCPLEPRYHVIDKIHLK